MKYVSKILIIIVILSAFSVHAYAGAEEEILKLVPDGAIFDQDINSENPDALLHHFSFNNILDIIQKSVKTYLPDFIKLLFVIFGYVFVFSVIEKINLSSQIHSQKFIISAVINAVLLIYLYRYFTNACKLVTENLKTIQVFCDASVPVLTALLIESGKNFSATLFSYAISLCSALLATLNSEIMLPMLHVFISIGSCSYLWDDIHFSAITELIKKFIKWLIGIVFSVFTFTLSVQSVLSRSADSITQKALKTAAGSIPMMGSVISKGLDSAFTLATGTKTTVATIGIAAIVSIFGAPAIAIALQSLALTLAQSISEVFGQKDCLCILKVMKEAYIILLNLFLISVLMSTMCFLILCIGAN